MRDIDLIVRPGQIWRERDKRYDRDVTVVGVAEPFVWVEGHTYKRRTRSRIARFVKAFVLKVDPTQIYDGGDA